MVQNKNRVWAGIYQIERQGKLALEHADVEGQPCLTKFADILAKAAIFRHGVRNDVQHPPHTPNDFLVHPVKPCLEPVGFWPCRADRPTKRAAGTGHQLGNPDGFSVDVGLGDVHLHVQDTGDSHPRGRGSVGFEVPVTIKGTKAGQPRIAEPRSVDKVQMRVEDHSALPDFACEARIHI